MMKEFFLFFLWMMAALISHAQGNDVKVYFKKPAKDFTESLPLGNGRIGAMVFGDTKRERIVLNEISLWSGGPQDADRDSAFVYLKPIQNLLLDGKNKEAQQLLMQHFVAKGEGSGHGKGANVKFGSYQTFGDIFIDWKDSASSITDYHRTLDIEHAIARVSYSRNNTKITEEIFTDFLNDILWIKIHSDKTQQLNFILSFHRKEHITKRYTRNNQIVLKGQLPSGIDKGMQFAAAAKPMITDGKMIMRNNSVEIINATECLIAVGLRTNYNYGQGGLVKSVNVIEKALSDLKKTDARKYTDAKNASVKKYRSYFDRCRIMFSDREAQTDTMTTQERLVHYAETGADTQLPALYFNFGRYLLISSSRPGLLPANLQGLWAEEYQAPWNGDYHLNINLQMNYWPANVTNLAELNDPLFQLTRNLMPNGRTTAKKYYSANGWTAHVVCNPWFFTSPGEGASWGSTLTGGAWLATHIWEHYRFTKNKHFLRQYYPVIKEAALFLQSILIKETVHGWYVTAPSNSPENTYIMPDGFQGNTCMGPTMDMQICRNIFSATIQAAGILGIDKDFSEKLNNIQKKLAPNQISEKDGGIQEWLNDWPSAEPHHRHVSHLFGLYPYDEINPWDTPELINAARKTLEMRGDGGTGWSRAWKINFRARLGDGDRALLLLKGLLQPAQANKSTGAGTYANLFDAHPPFQIDGNFGGAAGIAEMLMQSHGHQEAIRFLPALPAAGEWRSGKVKGLVARGNFIVDISWNNHALTGATIYSPDSNICKIVLPEGKKIVNEKGQQVHYTTFNQVTSFKTEAGKKYLVK